MYYPHAVFGQEPRSSIAGSCCLRVSNERAIMTSAGLTWRSDWGCGIHSQGGGSFPQPTSWCWLLTKGLSSSPWGTPKATSVRLWHDSSFLPEQVTQECWQGQSGNVFDNPGSDSQAIISTMPSYSHRTALWGARRRTIEGPWRLAATPSKLALPMTIIVIWERFLMSQCKFVRYP